MDSTERDVQWTVLRGMYSGQYCMRGIEDVQWINFFIPTNKQCKTYTGMHKRILTNVFLIKQNMQLLIHVVSGEDLKMVLAQ